jgi:hypothetical protein
VRRVQDFQVVRLEQADPLHTVTKLCARRTESDFIVATDPLKLAEVSVSMTGNADVSRLSDVSGTLDVSDTPIKSPVVRSFEYDIGDLKPGYFKSTQHCSPPGFRLSPRKSPIGLDNLLVRRPRNLRKAAFSRPLRVLGFQGHKNDPSQQTSTGQECDPVQN